MADPIDYAGSPGFNEQTGTYLPGYGPNPYGTGIPRPNTVPIGSQYGPDQMLTLEDLGMSGLSQTDQQYLAGLGLYYNPTNQAAWQNAYNWGVQGVGPSYDQWMQTYGGLSGTPAGGAPNPPAATPTAAGGGGSTPTAPTTPSASATTPPAAAATSSNPWPYGPNWQAPGMANFTAAGGTVGGNYTPPNANTSPATMGDWVKRWQQTYDNRMPALQEQMAQRQARTNNNIGLLSQLQGQLPAGGRAAGTVGDVLGLLKSLQGLRPA